MLKFGFSFPDLYSQAGLARIDAAFLQYLGEADAALVQRLAAARSEPGALAKKAESELLIALARHLEDFTAALFGIETEVQALSARGRNRTRCSHASTPRISSSTGSISAPAARTESRQNPIFPCPNRRRPWCCCRA